MIYPDIISVEELGSSIMPIIEVTEGFSAYLCGLTDRDDADRYPYLIDHCLPRPPLQYGDRQRPLRDWKSGDQQFGLNKRSTGL